MSDEAPRKIEDHVQSKETWLRFFYMLVLAVCFCIAEGVALAVVLFQFFCVLFTGERNDNLLRFGGGLSVYLFHTARFLTYNIDERPFPFSSWPESDSATATGSPSDE